MASVSHTGALVCVPRATSVGRAMESDKRSLTQTWPRPFAKSQAGQWFWKQSGTAGKMRLTNRIIRIWLWHPSLHGQMKKTLVVSPATCLSPLLAYVPGDPAAGDGDASCCLPVGADGEQWGCHRGPAWPLGAPHPMAAMGVCAEITGAELVMSLLTSLPSLQLVIISEKAP